MAEKKIQTRIRQKVDTKANWDKATNFIPLKGEIIIYSDLNQAKIGDGTTKVGALPFLKGKADASDKNPTLAWGSKSTVATVDGVDIHVTMPSNPNTHQSIKALNTNNTSAQTASSSEAIAGSGTINLHKVAKTGSYNDLNNKPTIPTIPTNLVTTNTTQTISGTKNFGAITANTIVTGPNANNYFPSQKFRGEGDAATYYHAVDFGYAGHDQVDFYEYGGIYNFYRNQQADTSNKQLLLGINPSGIKLPTVTRAKVLGTNADGQVESHALGIADISSLQSTLDSKVNSSSLANVATSGSYNDLTNKPTIPTIPTNLVTTNTEQSITGKKIFEEEVGFGNYVNMSRTVSAAPTNLDFVDFRYRSGAIANALILSGAGDHFYLAHLKPNFSIKASFEGNGETSDTYSASLGYTRSWLDYLTDWNYGTAWCVRPDKVSATTPAIIQIKFTGLLYTDVLRLILTGHNLQDNSGNNSGFLDNYTIEVCTNYNQDTWTTVVNRTNANDNIGKGLMYSLQTASYTECYGIRLKITKCHVNGQGAPFIRITTMQLRDYRPAIKFPDCLGVISQAGGDVWGSLNTKNNLVTHAVFPELNDSWNLGDNTHQYYGVYAGCFYENHVALSNKYMAKSDLSYNASTGVLTIK